MIETHDLQFSRQMLCRSQHGEDVGCRAEAHVPDYESFGTLLHPLRQTQLLHVERFSLGHWPYHRMKRLTMLQGLDARHAIRQLNNSIRDFQVVRPFVSRMMRVTDYGPTAQVTAGQCRAAPGPTRRHAQPYRTGGGGPNQ